jgi:YegS/Rv2252/BmrU family lipid kinase
MQYLNTDCMPSLKATAVVVGAQSRQGDAAFEALSARQNDVHSLSKVYGHDEFRMVATRAKESGACVLAVAGGDGALGKAAEFCVSNQMLLAIIPAGTGNALAHELEIPMDPLEALELVNTGKVREIDVATCNGTTFVTVMTLGISTSIAKHLKQIDKGKLGRFAYLPAVLRAVAKTRPTFVMLKSLDHEFEGWVMELVVASTKLHGGPFQVSDLAQIDDGLLSVYAVNRRGRAGLLRYALAMIRGKHTQLEHVRSTETPVLDVQLCATNNYVLDGDLYPACEARVVSQHRALRVMTPTTGG